MFVLRGILRAESQEKILIYLLLRGTGYGKGISEFFGQSQNAVQKQLARLEGDGVVVCRQIGKVREYELNPRYVFLPQLKELLKAALSVYPDDLRKALTMQRTRPRLRGKPIVSVRSSL